MRVVHTATCIAMALSALPSAAQVAVRRPTSGKVMRSIALAPMVRPLVSQRVVENADGSYVSDIDGKRRRFGFSPGSIHTIRGKGFGRRGSASTLLLKSVDGRYAGQLGIERWEDDLIVMRMPPAQSGFPANDQWNLLIMTAQGRSFAIPGARFAAVQTEVRLPIRSTDATAFEQAGMRWRRWNVGQEFFSAETDGSATMTRVIAYPKDRRTTPCPGPGSERIDVDRLQQGLRLAPGFWISRIAMSHGATDLQFAGRYAGSWEPSGRHFLIDWGVWRFRQDASFSFIKPWNARTVDYGRHVTLPTDDDAFAVCASEYSLTLFVTGPRGMRPR